MNSTSLLTHTRKLIMIGGCFAAAAGAWADSFTLSPGSPGLGIIPAAPSDILTEGVGGPAISRPFLTLGLTAADVVDAISDGLDPVFIPGHLNYFSVTPGSVGALGSGVAAEVAADTAPGVTPGHPNDIFLAGSLIPFGTNILAPAGFGWSLGTTTGDEANVPLLNGTPGPPPDNVNSYDLATLTPATAPIFFSLALGSPSLGLFGATADDVLAVGGAFGPVPVVFIDGVLGLGLPVGTDLDALAFTFTGGPPPAGSIEYSLTAGTAGLLGVSGADILGLGAVGPPIPVVVHTAASIGLLPGDDVDGLDVDNRIVPEPGSLALLALGALFLSCRPRRVRA